MSPPLAQSGHHTPEFQCPLLWVKRTSISTAVMSAFDPKRTSGGIREVAVMHHKDGKAASGTRPAALPSSPIRCRISPTRRDGLSNRRKSSTPGSTREAYRWALLRVGRQPDSERGVRPIKQVTICDIFFGTSFLFQLWTALSGSIKARPALQVYVQGHLDPSDTGLQRHVSRCPPP